MSTFLALIFVECQINHNNVTVIQLSNTTIYHICQKGSPIDNIKNLRIKISGLILCQGNPF